MAAPGVAASELTAATSFSKSCYLWLLSLLVCVVLVQGKQITCACSTDHCRAQNTNRCNTTYICYTQYLYKPDGSDPFTRGCIHSKTPLLCENRRPAIHSAAEWPLLACCSHNLCNQDALPLPPGYRHQETRPVSSVSSPSVSNNSSREAVVEGSEASTTSPVPESMPSQRLLSPVYLAVLAVGVCGLAVVALAVLVLLRRQAGMLGARYVRRGNYLKGRRQTTTDDPTLSLPLPNGGTYDNKMAVVS